MTPRAFIATFISFTTLACSATSPGSGGAGGSNPAGGDTAAAPAVGADTSATTGGGGGAAPASCKAEADHNACLNCCVSQYQKGATTYDVAFISHCGCAQGATCNSACTGQGDICVDSMAKSPSQDCVTCLDGLTASDACESGFHSDCEASSDCVNFVTCGASCPAM